MPQCNKILSIHLYYPLMLNWILLTLIQVLLKVSMFMIDNLGLLKTHCLTDFSHHHHQHNNGCLLLCHHHLCAPNKHVYVPKSEAEGNTSCSLMYACILQREALLKRLVRERVNEESGRKGSAKYLRE